MAPYASQLKLMLEKVYQHKRTLLSETWISQFLDTQIYLDIGLEWQQYNADRYTWDCFWPNEIFPGQPPRYYSQLHSIERKAVDDKGETKQAFGERFLGFLIQAQDAFKEFPAEVQMFEAEKSCWESYFPSKEFNGVDPHYLTDLTPALAILLETERKLVLQSQIQQIGISVDEKFDGVDTVSILTESQPSTASQASDTTDSSSTKSQTLDFSKPLPALPGSPSEPEGSPEPSNPFEMEVNSTDMVVSSPSSEIYDPPTSTSSTFQLQLQIASPSIQPTPLFMSRMDELFASVDDLFEDIDGSEFGSEDAFSDKWMVGLERHTINLFEDIKTAQRIPEKIVPPSCMASEKLATDFCILARTGSFLAFVLGHDEGHVKAMGKALNCDLEVHRVAGGLAVFVRPVEEDVAQGAIEKSERLMKDWIEKELDVVWSEIVNALD